MNNDETSIHDKMIKQYNDSIKRLAAELNHLENEFYINIGLNVGTINIHPSINNALTDAKLVEFNGDEWVAIEKEILNG